MTRTDITIGAAFSPSPAIAPPSGRLLLAGRAGQGPTIPTRVRSLAEWVTAFGGRTAAPATYDVLAAFFGEGGADCVFVRAAGTKATAATVSLETDKIVVTARGVGAYANGWQVAWAATSKTLTITAGKDVEKYTGTTFDELVAAAAVSTRVAVGGKGFPTADVAATPLTGGDDDYKTTDWGKVLAAFTADYGPGAVAVAGEPFSVVGAAMGEHCLTHGRLGLLSNPQGTAAGLAITNQATIAGYTGGAELVGLWPWLDHGSLPGVKVDPVGYAAGVRARNHGNSGPGRSPLRTGSTSATGLKPEVAATDAEAEALIKAHVSAVRSMGGATQLDGWYTAVPAIGLANLQGAQYADLLNSVRSRAQAVADQYIREPLTPVTISSFNGALRGMLANIPGPTWYPRIAEDGSQIDPGYIVDTSMNVNPLAALRENRLAADIKLRLAPTAEFVTITITAGDAALTF